MRMDRDICRQHRVSRLSLDETEYLLPDRHLDLDQFSRRPGLLPG